MSVTIEDAADHLKLLPGDAEGIARLQPFVDAANDWIASKAPDTTPAAVVDLATKFLIEHWYESQRGPSAVVVGEEVVYVDGRGYAIPNRVAQLLGLGAPSSPSGASSFPDARGWPDPVERCWWP